MLRRALAEDHPAINLVCLRTGDSGLDATALEDDQDLLGLIYAVPYQVLEPDFAFVVEGPGDVCGYILGSAAFYERPGANGFRRWRRGSPIQGRTRAGGVAATGRGGPSNIRSLSIPRRCMPGRRTTISTCCRRLGGMGIGSRGMRHLMAKLRKAGAPGMHLQVSPKNRDALESQSGSLVK